MKTKKETSLRIFTQLAESVYIAVRICSEGLSCFFHLRLWGLMEKITGRVSQASMCEVSTLLQLLRWENLDTFTALILKTNGKQTTDYSLLEYQMLQFGVSICGSGGFTLALIDTFWVTVTCSCHSTINFHHYLFLTPLTKKYCSDIRW